MLTQKSRFATEGARFMRNNPDGTMPRATRFLGFANTADLSAVTTLDIGSLSIKIDGAAVMTEDVDFTAAVDIAAVTVAEAVTALTAAAFAGITWSADAATGRLMGVAASGTYVQVYGTLAPALDFGQGIEHGGLGLKWAKLFNDRAISIDLPKNIKDKEEIDLEGAKGTITRMVIGSKLQGLSPVVTLKDKDYDLLELVQGGTYDRVNNTYDPPTSDESEHPQFFMEIFSPLYAEGTNKMENMSGYEKFLIRSAIGMEADVSIAAKSWATYAFNVEATDYYNESGVKSPSYQEATLTVAQFDALNVVNV
jgi:hypothetical protein